MTCNLLSNDLEENFVDTNKDKEKETDKANVALILKY